MQPDDIPIAEAAARAGFDCSNWPGLKNLISAVRAVNAPVSYPDRWTGPAAFNSRIYPDRWVADTHRQRKGVTQAYRDAETPTSVPAFGLTAQQIIDNIYGLTRGAPNPAVFTVRGSGSNRIPLGPSSGNKRANRGNQTSAPKRVKTENRPAPSRPGFTRDNFIDLTGDDPITYAPTRRQQNRVGSTNTTRRIPSARQRRDRQRVVQERVTHRETVGILAKIASKLRASAHALDVDRDTLRKRWDTDNFLQEQHITDHLSDLNRFFTQAEEGIRDALRVIENKLL